MTNSYKPSELGPIPYDWEVVPIGAMKPFVTSGSRGWAEYYSEFGDAFIRITNLSRDSIYMNLEDLRFVNLPKDDTEGNRTQLRENDVLVSITADIGIIGYVASVFPRPAYINQHIALVRLDQTSTCPKFVAYFWAAKQAQKRFRNLTDAGAKAGMSLMTVQKIPVALPPTKAEQEAIAEALTDADALIESLEQLIAKKRLLKQGAMQELFRPNIGGVIKQLREVSTLKGRIGWQGLKQTEFTQNADEPFLITGMNFKDGEIRWSEVYHISEERFQLAKEIQLETGDVLMTKDGTIGKILYIDKIPYPGKASLNSHLLLFRPICESYHPKYLYYQLSTRRFANFIELNKSGTTFFGISQASVGNYPVVLPAMKDQVQIAAILTDMDTEITALEAKLAKARQIKQGMMHNLLTGKIRLV